jgi:hypothetical protein
MVTISYSSNNTAALLEYMWIPPHKIRGVKQVLGNCILSNLNRVAFLEVSQALPADCPIFPFNTQVPTLGCFPHLLVASMLDVHISMLNGMAVCLVVNGAFHQVALPAISVTLSIYVFSNYIGSILITAAIWKLNFISSCVQH